jgi:alpha-galactosidase
MDRVTRTVVLGFFVSLVCVAAAAQNQASLRTSDVLLTFEAGATAPRLLTLQTARQAEWKNREPEPPIEYAEIDGERIPLKWQFNSTASHSDAHTLVFVYESASPKLRLLWEWRAPAGFGPIEHQIHIENLEARELWLPLQDSLRFNWELDPQSKVEQAYVEKGANQPSDIGTHEVEISAGYKWEGTSSTYSHPEGEEAREIIPWFLVKLEDAAQSGWYTGIEFSGRTHLTLSRDADSLQGVVGLNPHPGPFRTRLLPGETFDVPTIFVGGFTGGIDGAGNGLRRWVREVITNPLAWKDPHYPLTVNNSWGSGMGIDEVLAHRMIDDSAELGLEMFHMDAGWFRGVGDWYPNPQKFPHGLAAIADDAHHRGLKFGLWVDWTQAALDTAPGALNARDPIVRDWMVTDLLPDWKPEPFKGQTIDLGVPAAKAWAQREVTRIVDDYHLDMLEHDGYVVAQGCDRTDHPHAPPDPGNTCIHKAWGSYWVLSANSTDVSYHAVRAYYDIYSKLRAAHPGLLLEICDDGGRMIDFGSAAHGDYFSITDTYDPLSNRRAFYDASHLLPAAMLESYVERWPTPRIENFRYMLRSGMMGWMTIMMDTTAWTPEQHAVAKEEFALYKTRLREFIRDASLYHISSRPDGIHWDAEEYLDPQRGQAVVYIFRGSAENESDHLFPLRGFQSGHRYQLRFHDHSAPDRTATGQELEAGLSVHLTSPLSSELIFVEDITGR